MGIKKSSVFSTALFSLVSLVSGQGYGPSVDRVLSPESFEQVIVLWRTLGWHLSGLLMLPLLVYIVAGVFVFGEKSRDNFWALALVYFCVSFGLILVYPLLLLNLG